MNNEMRDQILLTDRAKQLAIRQVSDFLLWAEIAHGAKLKADPGKSTLPPLRDLILEYVFSEKVKP